MGLVLSMFVVVACTLTTPVLERSPDPVGNDIETIDHVMFDLDLTSFIRQRSVLRRTYPRLDWTTDGCSAPIVGESGRSFNFRHACMRHDFGYRNYKARDMFTTEARVRLDTQFRRDLDATCDPKVRTFKIRCIAWAEIFFTAVRLAGGP